MTPVIRPGYDEHLVEGSAEGFPADRTPTDTFLKMSTSVTSVKQFNLHAIGSFRECPNHKLLVLCLPSLHDWLGIRVNNRPNIVFNILLLSTLIMKRYLARGQRFKDILYIDFSSTRDTDMKIRLQMLVKE